MPLRYDFHIYGNNCGTKSEFFAPSFVTPQDIGTNALGNTIRMPDNGIPYTRDEKNFIIFKYDSSVLRI